jgi:hypothetical protein
MLCGNGYGRVWEPFLSDWRRRQARQSWRGNAGGHCTVGRRLDDPRDPVGTRAAILATILAGHVVASFIARHGEIVARNQLRVECELLEPVTGLGGKRFARGKDIQMPCKVCKTPSARAMSPLPRRLVSKMSDANQRLNATLPTHVAALTSGVPGVVDQIGGRIQLCLTSGPNAGQAEIESFTAQLHAARSLTKTDCSLWIGQRKDDIW